MFVPGENDVINSDESYRPGESQTDRVNGEYHYKNGYTQKIYSDAHYVREEDNTVPPRYYTPPEKSPREPREPKAPRKAPEKRGALQGPSVCAWSAPCWAAWAEELMSPPG